MYKNLWNLYHALQKVNHYFYLVKLYVIKMLEIKYISIYTNDTYILIKLCNKFIQPLLK